MQLSEALRALGVTDTTLSDDEKQFLDDNGYLPLTNVLSPDEVDAFRKRLGELAELEGEEAGKEVHQEAGTLRLSNLIDKDPIFEKCVTYPRLLAAIRHVIGPDFKLSSLNSRAALPGEGLQALHADWGEAVAADDYKVCNSIWLLDDFSAENGATRLVPGTHRSGQRPADAMADPKANHPDQIQIVAEAGTVVVFNSHTWHGGMTNRTDAPRRAMHVYFCRRDQKQQLDQRKNLRSETVARLSPEARVILDVEES